MGIRDCSLNQTFDVASGATCSRREDIMNMRRHVGVALGATLTLAMCLLLATASAAGPAQGGSAKMERFLLISPHTSDQCLKALDAMETSAPKLLAKMDWGCMAGDHTGYVEVEAASVDAARAMLPESARAQAKVVRLNKFTPEEIKKFHTKM
jgi:hypothetical protein